MILDSALPIKPSTEVRHRKKEKSIIFIIFHCLSNTLLENYSHVSHNFLERKKPPGFLRLNKRPVGKGLLCKTCYEIKHLNLGSWHLFLRNGVLDLVGLLGLRKVAPYVGSISSVFVHDSY